MAENDGFAAAARQYSQGPTGPGGGSLGAFAEGTLAPEFERVLATLDEGEISEPFLVDGSFHIIRVDQRLQGGRVPFEKVEDEIREKLYIENLDARFNRWVDEDLRKRHHVSTQLERFSGMARYPGS